MSTTVEQKTRPVADGRHPAVQFIKDNATLIALLVLCVGLSFADSSFFTARNLSNLARQVTIIGIISIGMTMVILIAGVDLSVGSVAGLAAIVVTMLMQYGLGTWLAVPITLVLVGGIVGLWNGWWIAHYKIPSFIITLGMLTIARGLALTLSGGSSIPVANDSFANLGGEYIGPTTSAVILVLLLGLYFYGLYRSIQQTRKFGAEVRMAEIIPSLIVVLAGIALGFYVFAGYQGIPIPVAIFGVIAFGGMYALEQTRFGRRIYALGGNEEAARLSGIDIFTTKLIVFVTVSVLAALSGILLASRLNGASPNLGTMFELDAIASVVIGGTSLAGGSGTIGGTIIGTLIIGVLNNGMSLLGVSTFYQLIIKGFIIILAVWFDVLQKRR
ncbi:MAG: sugar ABC transporter permease [Acetobacteraceae bacterium]|nr:sugar ABC transporter permease [Acetobacteraceae bacterium]